MISAIRLKGRALLIGSVFLFILTFAVGSMLIISLSMLPVIYKKALPYVSSYTDEYTVYVNAVLSCLIMLGCVLSFKAMRFGSDRYMLKKAENVHADSRDIFFYFRLSEIIPLFAVNARLMLIRLVLFIFVNIPTGICLSLLYFISEMNSSAAVVSIIAIGTALFLLSGIYFYLRLSSSLFLTKYYYIKGEYINFRHLISASFSAMKGRSNELFLLRVSFFGWFLSCVLLLPAGYVWGYYNQTLAAYANEIMKLQ